MEQKAVLEAIVKALDSKRAEDIQVIGVKNLTILGDYFVIANGTSTTHTKTAGRRSRIPDDKARHRTAAPGGQRKRFKLDRTGL